MDRRRLGNGSSYSRLSVTTACGSADRPSPTGLTLSAVLNFTSASLGSLASISPSPPGDEDRPDDRSAGGVRFPPEAPPSDRCAWRGVPECNLQQAPPERIKARYRRTWLDR